MGCRIVGICLLVLLPGTVVAQAQTKAKTVEQLAAEVESLRTTLSSANENLTKLAAKVADNTQAVTSNSEGLTRLAEQMNQELSKQQVILERIDELAIQMQEQLARQQAILDAIVQRDAQGNDVLRLSANMARSDEFRADVRQAVHQSLESHGDVVIRNMMAGDQRVSVNQKEYSLGPGEVLNLKVPVGTVSVQLPGQALTNWTLTAPEYLQKIDIVPDTNARVAYRPITTDPVTADSVAPLLGAPVEAFYPSSVPLSVPVPLRVHAPMPWVIWSY
jgi:hypothetical protein